MQRKDVQIWRPVTGSEENPSFHIDGEFTSDPLHLAKREALFLIFRNKAATSSRVVPVPSPTLLAEITGPWQLRFPGHLGAPATVSYAKLASWIQNPDPGVNFFSGTATYSRSIQISKAWLPSRSRILLDLGTVRDLAEVRVNGRAAGLVWAPRCALVSPRC